MARYAVICCNEYHLVGVVEGPEATVEEALAVARAHAGTCGCDLDVNTYAVIVQQDGVTVADSAVGAYAGARAGDARISDAATATGMYDRDF